MHDVVLLNALTELVGFIRLVMSLKIWSPLVTCKVNIATGPVQRHMPSSDAR